MTRTNIGKKSRNRPRNWTRSGTSSSTFWIKRTLVWTLAETSKKLNKNSNLRASKPRTSRFWVFWSGPRALNWRKLSRMKSLRKNNCRNSRKRTNPSQIFWFWTEEIERFENFENLKVSTFHEHFFNINTNLNSNIESILLELLIMIILFLQESVTSLLQLNEMHM